MKVTNIKKIALAGVAVMALGFGANQAHAQATATFGSTFTTAAALSATAGDILDFGTWAVVRAGVETPTIIQAATVGAPTVGTVGGVTASTVTNTVPPATAGSIEVNSPITGDVQLRQVTLSSFSEPTLTLSAITYADGNGNSGTLPTVFDPTEVINVQAAGVDETVGFGGTITISGTPAAATPFTDATVTVEFAY